MVMKSSVLTIVKRVKAPQRRETMQEEYTVRSVLLLLLTVQYIRGQQFETLYNKLGASRDRERISKKSEMENDMNNDTE